jgi:hypothetical protein
MGGYLMEELKNEESEENQDSETPKKKLPWFKPAIRSRAGVESRALLGCAQNDTGVPPCNGAS